MAETAMTSQSNPTGGAALLYSAPQRAPKAGRREGKVLRMSVGQVENAREPVLPLVAAGDQSAVERCMDEFGGLVWSLARKTMPDQHTAEDAVQDIFIDVWKNAGRFDPEKGSETTFIATIARRRLIDRLRQMGRKPGGVALDDIHESAGQPATSDGITLSEEAQIARSVMDELGEGQKHVLELAILRGQTHERIADVTGMPLGTVKTHARRGLIKIREAIQNRKAAARGAGSGEAAGVSA